MDNVKNQQGWITFLSNFESENKDFIVALSSKHPELTKSQFQVCLYLRSGFDTKAIAQALDLSIRSVESHCYRIRKKLELHHNTNLGTYLYSIA